MRTPPRPVIRRAARVLLVDPEGRVLLIRGGDPAAPDAGTWWITPGGGIEGDESAEQAAAREAEEETGLRPATLVGPVLERASVFPFGGRMIDQREQYFLARVSAFEPSATGWTDFERTALHELRWWTVAELRATSDTVHPEGLAELIDRLVPDRPGDTADSQDPPR